MYAGRIVEDVSKEELVNDPKHPYTQMLMTALPVLGSGEVESLTEIPGEVPEVTSPPPGCSFHPRCPLARDICRTERPPLVRRPTGRRVACWVANEGED
jgi:oligopeptide/dipeptide ABC transporter ATP-binding protein